jgi:hypothetical protein
VELWFCGYCGVVGVVVGSCSAGELGVVGSFGGRWGCGLVALHPSLLCNIKLQHKITI